MKKRVYGLVGPTASGKTALSLKLAQALGGEILCMDSMQIYRGMDIGTAKPTAEERAAAPHHLLDIADPAAPFSVTDYVRAARPLLDSVEVPILVGGTGFYLRGLSQPMDYGYVKGDPALRGRYEALAAEAGVQAVHDRLRAVDPVSADRLHPNDLRRVIQRRFRSRTGNLRALRVNIISFGFKYGVPREADYVFDLRFLPNPYFVSELRAKSGKDSDVADYVFATPKAREFRTKLLELIFFILPLMENEGRYRLTIAFGCTGGRHRSVAVAEAVHTALHQAGYPVTLEHRHLELG